MFFYELDRFSTDLDFNCLTEDFDFQVLTRMLEENYPELKISFQDKHFTYFWLIDTGRKEVNIKIEIRKKAYTSTYDIYEIKDLNGVSIKTMRIDCMLSHKLCAALDRQQNRDIYDIWFMLNKGVDINQDIVTNENPIQPGISLRVYLQKLREHITVKLNQKNVLDDIGNLLYTEGQKDRVKAVLIPKLTGFLDTRIADLDNLK